MIPTHIIERVFRIYHNGRTATAYTIDRGDTQFLVSASHIFDGCKNVTSIQIFHDKKWKNLDVITVFNSLDIGDTIIFKLKIRIAQKSRTEFGSYFVLGSWAYFLGFPLGFGTDSSELNNKYPMPFIKAALISAFYTDKEGLVEIYLDGHNNKGFSGGPVVVEHMDKKRKFIIIGTISGYITEATIHNETKEEVNSYQTNAGIIEAFSINDVVENL